MMINPAKIRPDSFRRPLIFLFAVLLLMSSALLFCGCSELEPIVFHSELSIYSNESGVRTITASASKDTVNSLLGSKNNSFQSFLTAYCPDLISWECTETGSTYELTFRISFDSLDGYRSAIAELTGSDSVSVTRPQTGVSTGFTLTETSSVTELFGWLSEALVSRAGISDAKISGLLLAGSNDLLYAGRSYKQTGNGMYVYIETLYNADRIDILTDLSLNNTWKRTILIQFPDSILENASNIKPYLSSLLPEGLTEEWQYDTIWVVTFPETTLEQMNQLTGYFFQSREGCGLEEDISAETIMHYIHRYTEHVNVSFFVPDSDSLGETSGKTVVRYYIRNAEGAELSLPAGDGTSSPVVSLNQDYSGYLCLANQTISEGDFSFTASYQYQPLEIVLDTRILSSGDLNRTITLEMGEFPSLTHRQTMLRVITERAGKAAFVSEEIRNSLYRILIQVKGSDDDINQVFQSIFQSPGNFHYSRSLNPFKKQLTASWSDELNFDQFLSANETLVTARVILPDGEAAESSDSLTAVSRNRTISLSGSTSRFNLLFVWVPLLLLLLLACLLFNRFIPKKPVRKRSAKK